MSLGMTLLTCAWQVSCILLRSCQGKAEELTARPWLLSVQGVCTDKAAPLPIPVVVIREHSEQISQATMRCSPLPSVPKCCPAQCGCGTAVYSTLEVFMEELMAGGAYCQYLDHPLHCTSFLSCKVLISVDEWEQFCCSCSAGAVCPCWPTG